MGTSEQTAEPLTVVSPASPSVPPARSTRPVTPPQMDLVVCYLKFRIFKLYLTVRRAVRGKSEAAAE